MGFFFFVVIVFLIKFSCLIADGAKKHGLRALASNCVQFLSNGL